MKSGSLSPPSPSHTPLGQKSRTQSHVVDAMTIFSPTIVTLTGVYPPTESPRLLVYETGNCRRHRYRHTHLWQESFERSHVSGSTNTPTPTRIVGVRPFRVRDLWCTKPKETASLSEGSRDMTEKGSHVLRHTRSHDPWEDVTSQVGLNTETSGGPHTPPYRHPKTSTPLRPRRPGLPFDISPSLI